MRWFLRQLFFWQGCRENGVPMWSCPSFLFVVMGILTIGSILAAFIVSRAFVSPELVFPIVVFAGMSIFIHGSIVVRNFDRIAQESRMKSEFVSIASHQLRSPLSAMKWVLDLLLSGRVGEVDVKKRGYLFMVRDHNEAMIKLVNDLLNTSRVDKGELRLRRERVNLTHIVSAAVEEKKVFAQARNIKFVTEIAKVNIFISGDETYLKLVVANFIDNAIRYTSGEGTVKVRLFVKDSFAKCEVEDMGVGIPKTEQKHIFKKFFRARNVLKNQTEGTGLGLFIAHAVIKQSVGRIGFYSREGEGSTFWFEIPLTR